MGGLDPARRYALSDHATVRAERFGGLIYRHDNRRLYCVRSGAVIELLGCLDGSRSLGQWLEHFMNARGLPATSRASLLGALARLHALEVVREV